jgi:hypothetical protein
VLIARAQADQFRVGGFMGVPLPHKHLLIDVLLFCLPLLVVDAPTIPHIFGVYLPGIGHPVEAGAREWEERVQSPTST